MDTRLRQHGSARLIRGLDAVEYLVARRPAATQRLQYQLGAATADGLIASLVHTRAPAHRRRPHGWRNHAATPSATHTQRR
jgi:hypothetical protein